MSADRKGLADHLCVNEGGGKCDTFLWGRNSYELKVYEKLLNLTLCRPGMRSGLVCVCVCVSVCVCVCVCDPQSQKKHNQQDPHRSYLWIPIRQCVCVCVRETAGESVSERE